MKTRYPFACHPPPPSNVSRRMLLALSTAMMGQVILANHARTQPSNPAQQPDTPFMALSALLIAHRLDPVIGRRLAAALQADQRPLSDHIDFLLKLARAHGAKQVEDFFPFTDGPERGAALRIISAWYLGVVDNVPEATVFAYERALMFQPTADVMTIPTYAISGPNGWGPTVPRLEAMPVF